MYYGRDVDPTIFVDINTLSTIQSSPKYTHFIKYKNNYIIFLLTQNKLFYITPHKLSFMFTDINPT